MILNQTAYLLYIKEYNPPTYSLPELVDDVPRQYEINKGLLKDFIEPEQLVALDRSVKFISDKESDCAVIRKNVKKYREVVGQLRELSYFNAIGWFFRFYLRSEFACDTEECCQFPYMYYGKYLCRREAYHLVKHVSWTDETARSKNALNKLKMRVQLASKDEYSILVKNEAHVRMASSSRFVAFITKKYLSILFLRYCCWVYYR
ncbi:MAG: hypothetical protein LUD76_07795 [Alistipes sp.]|nr:hypothetical protein [Alistipes sp.]